MLFLLESRRPFVWSSTAPSNKLSSMEQHTVASCDVTMESRANDAIKGMSSCVARMVADKEQLVCNSGGKSFQISAVMDGGGFATLLKGQVTLNGIPQVSSPCTVSHMSRLLDSSIGLHQGPHVLQEACHWHEGQQLFPVLCCRSLLPR
jgi:hypothetical protein